LFVFHIFFLIEIIEVKRASKKLKNGIERELFRRNMCLTNFMLEKGVLDYLENIYNGYREAETETDRERGRDRQRERQRQRQREWMRLSKLPRGELLDREGERERESG
jgi:hypothetical protein